MLQGLLGKEHGYRLGVIVNDMAAVNVDARVLEGAMQRAGVKSVELANGCVCCTASDDLRASVLELLRDSSVQRLDAIVVELSGVAEPKNVAKALSGLEAEGAP